ncbi:uncharacterized protein JCM6883_004929 [Sporobolomyces salmoneus]|uniref:uncharacterized protein n=1 Tax=Sporobolomyces salmoneus TaxID=183962 RepID=UPI003175C122
MSSSNSQANQPSTNVQPPRLFSSPISDQEDEPRSQPRPSLPAPAPGPASRVQGEPAAPRRVLAGGPPPRIPSSSNSSESESPSPPRFSSFSSRNDAARRPPRTGGGGRVRGRGLLGRGRGPGREPSNAGAVPRQRSTSSQGRRVRLFDVDNIVPDLSLLSASSTAPPRQPVTAPVPAATGSRATANRSNFSVAYRHATGSTSSNAATYRLVPAPAPALAPASRRSPTPPDEIWTPIEGRAFRTFSSSIHDAAASEFDARRSNTFHNHQACIEVRNEEAMDVCGLGSLTK